MRKLFILVLSISCITSLKAMQAADLRGGAQGGASVGAYWYLSFDPIKRFFSQSITGKALAGVTELGLAGAAGFAACKAGSVTWEALKFLPKQSYSYFMNPQINPQEKADMGYILAGKGAYGLALLIASGFCLEASIALTKKAYANGHSIGQDIDRGVRAIGVKTIAATALAGALALSCAYTFSGSTTPA